MKQPSFLLFLPFFLLLSIWKSHCSFVFYCGNPLQHPSMLPLLLLSSTRTSIRHRHQAHILHAFLRFSMAERHSTVMVETASQRRRRSPRLVAAKASKDEILSNATSGDDTDDTATQQGKRASMRKRSSSSTTDPPQTNIHDNKAATPKKKKTTSRTNGQKKDDMTPPGTASAAAVGTCLPRTRETALLLNNNPLLHVMGIDEAGRGPLCGPVVAAAAIVSTNISGITDSKKLVCERVREALYQQIITSPHARWAVAVVDATTIDQINILQATLQAMRWAALGCVLGAGPFGDDDDGKNVLVAAKKEGYRYEQEASIEHVGCYVVFGATDAQGNSSMMMTSPLEDSYKASNTSTSSLSTSSSSSSPLDTDSVYALIDGNRLPQDMPCAAETVVKGDSKEYSIAAASILAKVTRDRLMNEYDKLYPIYNLKQHKGYPTAVHMAAVHKHGASPIHRRSFAPLKHMKLDASGRIIE